jgi:hypothetical protein
MDDYYNIIAIYDNSNIRLTMERYSYNLWALIAIIASIIILKIADSIYLYNIIILFIFAAFLSIYFNYMKND